MVRHRRHALRWLAVSVIATAGLVFAAWVGTVKDIEWLGGVGGLLASVCVVLAGVGAGGLYANVRMRRILASGPWLTRRAYQLPSHRMKGVGVVLREPHGGLHPLLVFTVRGRYEYAAPGPEGTLWWCPGANGRGVLVRPQGGELIYARTPFTAWGRRVRIEAAKKAGLDS